jgi:DNA-binding MarR family transcriptional regulator
VTDYYDRALRPSGVTATQVSLLGAIAMTGPAPIQRLAEALDLDHTTLTRNLKLLDAAGWIAVRPGADRRERMIALSPAGESVLARALPYWQAAQRRIQERFGPDRWRRLLDDLGELSALGGDSDGAERIVGAGLKPAPTEDANIERATGRVVTPDAA